MYGNQLLYVHSKSMGFLDFHEMQGGGGMGFGSRPPACRSAGSGGCRIPIPPFDFMEYVTIVVATAPVFVCVGVVILVGAGTVAAVCVVIGRGGDGADAGAVPSTTVNVWWRQGLWCSYCYRGCCCHYMCCCCRCSVF